MREENTTRNKFLPVAPGLGIAQWNNVGANFTVNHKNVTFYF